ncbi:MAG: TIR domain-containing protein [Chloroflexi bacterium]|nr:TIR domain-containing protein [Chloroflexota bacterium]MCC6894007.1 TIR domain-containing protein [Anaerolineae bacterium]
MTRIFINYRRQDSEGYVGRLYDHLTQHFTPQDIFMDVDSIPPGVDFVQALEDAVADCDIFLAMVGPQWLTLADEHGERRLDQWNDFVRIEICSALKQGKVIIPVLVGRSRMPNPAELPDEMKPFARRNALELSQLHFAQDVKKLAKAIQDAAPAKQNHKPRPDSETLNQKEAAIKQVRLDLVGATESPLYQFRIENRLFPVIGEGNPDANIVFIGEAPGKNEAAAGRPFIGPSGEVLAEMLKSINLLREDVFVTNILLDRPPEKRDPTPEEIAFYEPFVDRILDIIQPAVIATLGRFAMQYVLKRLDLPEKREPISKLHGKLIKARMHYGEVHIVPLYHPAVVLYSASQKATLQKDFEKLKLFI